MFQGPQILASSHTWKALKLISWDSCFLWLAVLFHQDAYLTTSQPKTFNSSSELPSPRLESPVRSPSKTETHCSYVVHAFPVDSREMGIHKWGSVWHCSWVESIQDREVTTVISLFTTSAHNQRWRQRKTLPTQKKRSYFYQAKWAWTCRAELTDEYC